MQSHIINLFNDYRLKYNKGLFFNGIAAIASLVFTFYFIDPVEMHDRNSIAIAILFATFAYLLYVMCMNVILLIIETIYRTFYSVRDESKCTRLLANYYYASLILPYAGLLYLIVMVKIN
jgi:hypothetical protein